MMQVIAAMVVWASPPQPVRLEAMGWARDGSAFVAREDREDACRAVAVTDAKTSMTHRYEAGEAGAKCPKLSPRAEYDRWVAAHPLAPAASRSA